MVSSEGELHGSEDCISYNVPVNEGAKVMKASFERGSFVEGVGDFFLGDGNPGT